MTDEKLPTVEECREAVIEGDGDNPTPSVEAAIAAAFRLTHTLPRKPTGSTLYGEDVQRYNEFQAALNAIATAARADLEVRIKQLEAAGDALAAIGTWVLNNRNDDWSEYGPDDLREALAAWQRAKGVPDVTQP